MSSTAAAPSRPRASAAGIRRRINAGHRPFILRRLHSLTGILLCGFVLSHLLIAATLVEGFREGSLQTVYQKQISSIHAMPFLTPAIWLFVYVPLLFHAVYGAWLIYEAQPNTRQYPYGKNVFYLIQQVSSLFLVAFILFHVTAFRGWWSPALKFDPWRASETTVGHITESWIIAWFVYPLGILAASFHVAYGFWTAAITWGLTVTAVAQRRCAWICTAIFLFTYACGMTALLAALSPAALARHG